MGLGFYPDYKSVPRSEAAAAAGEAGQPAPASAGKIRRLALPGGLFLLLGLLFLLAEKGGGDRSAKTELASAPLAAGGLSLSVWNDEYSSSKKGTAAYPFLRGSVHLVEPMRESTFAFSSPSRLSKASYHLALHTGGGPWDDMLAWAPEVPARDWALTDVVDADAQEKSGQLQFKAQIPFPGVYHLRTTLTMDDGTVVEHFAEIQSYYIRRELRSMSSKDRKLFLDAVKVMLETPKEKGQSAYGKHFRTINSLTEMHLQMAAARDLDHLHDGLGFLTQHIAITSEFELSIQSIAPAIAVPFWDFVSFSALLPFPAETNFKKQPTPYLTSPSRRTTDFAQTIDTAKVTVNSWNGGRSADDGEIFTNGELFTDAFFGTTDEKLHTVTEGRFALQEVPRDYEFSTRSAYGFLRAPWNLNPSKYVTRCTFQIEKLPKVWHLYAYRS